MSSAASAERAERAADEALAEASRLRTQADELRATRPGQ